MDDIKNYVILRGLTPSFFMQKIWEIWKYSLGSFSDDKTAPYDNYVAIIRTSIFVSYMVTNAFIVSGVIRHWDKVNSNGSLGHTTQTEVPNVQGTTSPEKI